MLLGALGGCAYGLGTGNVVKGSGILKTETVPVNNITALLFGGLGTVQIAQTGIETLTITAEDNILPQINAGMQGTTLNIHNQLDTTLQPTKPIIYVLTVKDLSAITLSGVGSITTAQFKTTNLSLSMSGAGNVGLSGLTVTQLSASLSGSGNVMLSGQAHSQDVTCSGVGSYDASSLASQTATMRLSGVGSAKVRVSDALDVTISGVGSLTYYGNPTVTKHITGVGSVMQG